MTVDKSDVENILEHDDFHVNELRNLVEERRLDVDKRFKADMIAALLADKWTEQQVEGLKDTFARIQREREPLGYYIAKVEGYPDFTDQPTHEELKQKLLVDAVKRDGRELHERGFEVETVHEGEVSGIYWTQTRSFTLDALRNLTSHQRVYDIGFEFDIENGILHINADNYGKRGEVINEFKSKGVEIEPVGHEDESSPNANSRVRDFVKDLEQDLEEDRRQMSIADFNGDAAGPELLEVETVEIKLTDGKLKTANLEGYEGIFDSDVVTEFTEDKNGRIIHLRGEFVYRETDFGFHVGLPERLGRVRVRKKGSPDDNVDLLEDAFDLLFNHFEEHFID